MEWKNKRIVFARTIKHREQMTTLLEAAGAKLMQRISTHTAFFVTNRKTGNTFAMAKTLGTPIVSEDEFIALLTGEPVAVKPTKKKKKASAKTNATIEKLRDLLHTDPSRKGWLAICKTLEKCSPEVRQVAIDYTTQAAEAWSGTMANFSIYPKIRYERLLTIGYYQLHLHPQGSTFTPLTPDEIAHLPILDFRLMPLTWQKKLLQREYLPQFQVVRALGFHKVRINSTVARNILECPYFTNLQALYLESRLLTLNFAKDLAASDNMPNLTHLDVSGTSIQSKGVSALCSAPQRAGLKHLNIANTGLNVFDPVLPAHLESLDLSKNNLWGNTFIEGPKNTRIYADPAAHWLHTLLAEHPLKKLALTETYLNDTTIKILLSSGALTQMTHLDLSSNPQLSNKAISLLADAIPELVLEHLDIRVTHTTYAGRSALRQVCADHNVRLLETTKPR